MTLEQQIFDWQRIHDIANACPGKPVDQAMAGVREFLRQRHLIAIDINRLGFVANTVEGGIRDIERGKNEQGLSAIRDAAEYLRGKIEEARS